LLSERCFLILPGDGDLALGGDEIAVGALEGVALEGDEGLVVEAD
jgi:hypothetical protein